MNTVRDFLDSLLDEETLAAVKAERARPYTKQDTFKALQEEEYTDEGLDEDEINDIWFGGQGIDWENA